MVGQMNTGRRLPFGAVAAGLALLAVAGGSALLWTRGGGAGVPAPLAGSGIGGPFTLVDQDGRTVSDRDFAGRYRLIYFGYTFCPDVCPTDLARNAAALRAFAAADAGRAARVAPIFITIDPARDTPGVLRQYVSNFPPRLIALTGSPAAIEQTERAYKVFAAKQETKGASGYLMSHTDLTYLMGPNGEPIAFFTGTDTAAKLAADFARYVR